MGDRFKPRWFLMAVLAFLLFAAGARQRAEELQAQAALSREQSQAAGERFADTFDGAEQDAELRHLDERRRLMAGASVWQGLSVFAFAFAVLSLFGAWVARELRKVTEVIGSARGESPGRAASGR